MNLTQESRKALATAKKRIEHGALDDDILKHCAGELVEAVQARAELRKPHDGFIEPLYGFNYAEELADVIICVLIAAGEDNIDIEGAVRRKMEKNERRALGIGDKL